MSTTAGTTVPTCPRIRLPHPTTLALLRGVVEDDNPYKFLRRLDMVESWFTLAEQHGLVREYLDPEPTKAGDTLYSLLCLGELPLIGQHLVWPWSPVWQRYFPVGTSVVPCDTGYPAEVVGHTPNGVQITSEAGPALYIARALYRTQPLF